MSKPNHGDGYYDPNPNTNPFNPEVGLPPDDGELTMPHPNDEEN